MTESACPSQSWSRPTEADVTAALVHTADPQRRRAFYDGLKNPNWLEPLARKGAFTEAPGPQAAEEGWIQYSPWPEGDYLVRVAPEAPAPVVEVLLNLDDKDNPFAHRLLVDAALAMPISEGARLVRRVCQYLAAPRRDLINPYSLVTLVERLAASGITKELGHLVDAMYEPRQAPRTDESPAPFRDIPTGLDSYWYAVTLPRVFEALRGALGLTACRILIRWLATWQRLSGYAPYPDYDVSCVWRPWIEAAQDIAGYHLGDPLVDVLRDGLIQAAREGTPLAEITDMLSCQTQPIFRRLALHMLAMVVPCIPGEDTRPLARGLLISTESFDLAVRHEFAQLARVVLPEADDEYLATWLEQLRDYRPVNDEELRERLAGKGRSPEEVSEDELRLARHRYQRSLLVVIGDALPELLSAALAELDAELGEREDGPADTPFKFDGMFTGPTSPKLYEELRAMTIPAVLDYLRAWQPPPRQGWPPPPTPEGLGRVLAEVVRDDPDGYAEWAGAVVGLDPTYVRSVLHGFELSLRSNRPVPWGPMLEIIEFVSSQPDGGEDPAAAMMEHDVGWRWTHAQAATILSLGLHSRGAIRPDVELGEQIWVALRPLIESPHPSLEDEASYAGSMGPLDRSLNVVRGQAMRAAIAYVQWVTEEDTRREDSVQEVLEVLDRHLEPSVDPSAAVRSVYGQHFGSLLDAVPTWARSAVTRIFGNPREDVGFDGLQRAAWDSFLMMHDPTETLFDVLRAQYEAATVRLRDVAAERPEAGHADSMSARLAEHILLLYAWGVIGLDSDDGLIAEFFAAAPTELIAEALSHLGWRIFRTSGPLGQQLLDRLMALWDWRDAEAEAGRADLAELRGFGWWLRSNRYPVAWVLPHMVRVAEAPYRLDMTEQIAELVGHDADTHTRERLRIITGLLHTSERGWTVSQLGEHAVDLIAVALDSDERDLQAMGQSLLNEFGRAGALEIRTAVDAARNASNIARPDAAE